MARWGKCDYKQLQDFQKALNRLQGEDRDAFCEKCVKELASRLLAKVIRRTPVGQYPSGSGKNGGTLRRNWSIGKVTKAGGIYEIEVINSTEYASYVEHGHRTRDHKGWVSGRFMLTISENELNVQAPKILENKLMKYLGECFDGK